MKKAGYLLLLTMLQVRKTQKELKTIKYHLFKEKNLYKLAIYKYF
jgi:hypothetical protein